MIVTRGKSKLFLHSAIQSSALATWPAACFEQQTPQPPPALFYLNLSGRQLQVPLSVGMAAYTFVSYQS